MRYANLRVGDVFQYKCKCVGEMQGISGDRTKIIIKVVKAGDCGGVKPGAIWKHHLNSTQNVEIISRVDDLNLNSDWRLKEGDLV